MTENRMLWRVVQVLAAVHARPAGGVAPASAPADQMAGTLELKLDPDRLHGAIHNLIDGSTRVAGRLCRAAPLFCSSKQRLGF